LNLEQIREEIAVLAAVPFFILDCEQTYVTLFLSISLIKTSKVTVLKYGILKMV